VRTWVRPALPLLAAAVFAPAPAAARPAGFLRPVGQERLVPGQTVEVEWPPLPVPDDADEMELVLSLDGGRTFTVRVTEEIATSDIRVSWRVPALSASHARLALRAGERGEEGSERILIVSEDFEIRPEASRPPEALLAVRAEWRTREAVALPAPAFPAPRRLAAEPELRAADWTDGAESLPLPDALEVARRISVPLDRPPAPRDAVGPAAPRPDSRLTTPLRL
jgi:hypothetical protein